MNIKISARLVEKIEPWETDNGIHIDFKNGASVAVNTERLTVIVTPEHILIQE